MRKGYCVMLGTVDEDLSLLEIGPLCHSRWLTLACRILHYYVSQKSPTKNLKTLAQFCILIYFSCWFLIKRNHKLTDGPKNYFTMIKLIQQFPSGEARNVALKNILRNSYWAHPECILTAMLCDNDSTVRNIAVNKILAIRGDLEDSDAGDSDVNFVGGDLEVDDDSGDEIDEYRSRDNSVRYFKVPIVNEKAKSYYKLSNLSLAITEPPITKKMSREELEKIRELPYEVEHPYHNQCVETHQGDNGCI